MEQLHNESNQNNTVRNLLIILLVVVVGLGGFIVYNIVYNSPAPNTAQNNTENPYDKSVDAVENKIQTWLSNTYHSLTPEMRTVVNGVGALVVARVLWPIFKRKNNPDKRTWRDRSFRRNKKNREGEGNNDTNNPSTGS